MEFDIEMEKSEYELMREKNMKAFESLLQNFEDEVDESINILNNAFKKESSKLSKRKKQSVDPTLFFRTTIPVETRRSARLSNITPQYTYTDLPDEDFQSKKRKYNDDEIDNLEEVVFQKRQSYSRKSTTAVSVPVDQITQKYLDNIAMRVIEKVYSPSNGTSCHQCRQKTLDSKTYCRSGHCVGLRGQFCGVCLKNRYGEDAETVLLDSNWKCPPCRGLCNCSICRAREGKRPTGILAPIAFQHGHKSVKDFLLSLGGEGDYVDEPQKTKIKNDKRENCEDEKGHLLGFNKDHKPIWTSESQNLSLDDKENLLGFNGDTSVMI